MRQIILDTETTGLDPSDGHRIIEIGCVEMVKRRVTNNDYHQYLQPDRASDEDAEKVHGITSEFLADKPRFKETVNQFMSYIKGAELIIHNAPFDVGFINSELSRINSSWGKLEDHCTIIDSLVMARQSYPGQRNSLDALCKRLGIGNTHRELHGALLDSQILAEVYLAMTGGQRALIFNAKEAQNTVEIEAIQRLSPRQRTPLKIIYANDADLAKHNTKVAEIAESSGVQLWN
ncbi:MAG: DNA polymerase III subunit epsilon [Thiotrichaceae bacterium]|nr:DNA polymerase III subunit epsilon [Thiotrichaceae bacterium]